MLVLILDWFCFVLYELSFCSSSNSSKTIQSMGFLDQLSRLETSQIRGTFLIVAPLSLVNQWHSEAATRALDMVAILYHGSADAKDLLVQQEFFYTDQFVPKVYVSKLKRHNSTKVSAKHYYNDLFCRYFGLMIISSSLEDSLLNNHKISSR